MNALNQYTEISSAEPNQQTAEPSNQPSSLQLSYDADGNATQVQTSTGTWNVEYNAENRPVRWTNAETGTVITMTFDSQGRRTEYKSVTNGMQNTWLRFLYDGYLCVQVLYSNAPYNVFKEFVWDPTEPVATRPLVFRYAPNNLNLFYAFDGNKNVSDVFYRLNSNGIGAHYDYAPFGAVTRTHSDSSASFDIVSLNPFRFSSEYYDSELDLVYYNYRHYSPALGRFLSRDPIEEQGGLNLYAFVENKLQNMIDIWGNWAWPWEDVECIIREETWSAIKLLERKGNELAETTGEIEVKHVSCNCEKGKWIFSGAKVYLYITVHTFSERYYERMNIPFAWVKRCEYDHVADMKAWAKGAGDEIVEQFSFSSQKNKVGCQHDAQNELQNKLFGSLKMPTTKVKKIGTNPVNIPMTARTEGLSKSARMLLRTALLFFGIALQGCSGTFKGVRDVPVFVTLNNTQMSFFEHLEFLDLCSYAENSDVSCLQIEGKVRNKSQKSVLIDGIKSRGKRLVSTLTTDGHDTKIMTYIELDSSWASCFSIFNPRVGQWEHLPSLDEDEKGEYLYLIAPEEEVCFALNVSCETFFSPKKRVK